MIINCYSSDRICVATCLKASLVLAASLRIPVCQLHRCLDIVRYNVSLLSWNRSSRPRQSGERTFFAVRVFTCVPFLFLIPLSPLPCFLRPPSFFVPAAPYPRSQAFLSSSLSVTDDQPYHSFAFLPFALLSQPVRLASPSSLLLSLSFSLCFFTSLPFPIRLSSDNEKPSLRGKRETIGNTTTIIVGDFAFIAARSRSGRG